MTAPVDQRHAIVAEALSWLRTPYRNNARVKGHGADCAQLLIGIYSNVGLVPPMDPHYAPDRHLHRRDELFLSFVEQHADQVPEAQLRPGDVVVWKYGRSYSHGAIFIGAHGLHARAIIHAQRQARSVVLGSMDESLERERAHLCYTLRVLK